MTKFQRNLAFTVLATLLLAIGFMAYASWYIANLMLGNL